MLYSLNPTTKEFLKMLWNNCKDKWPSHNDLGNRAVAGDLFTAENMFLTICLLDRLVPVNIDIRAQSDDPASVPRPISVQVPAHALQMNNPTYQLFQQVLTQATTQALMLPENDAAVFLQTQINNLFYVRIMKISNDNKITSENFSL